MTTADTVDKCPFCLANNLFKGDILAKSSAGYLTHNIFNPGNYLIIPHAHIESPLELPDTWWHDMSELIAHVPELGEHYNISLNVGTHAGQTQKHLHFWVIPRSHDHPAKGKGLARLISEASDI